MPGFFGSLLCGSSETNRVIQREIESERERERERE
jgi:hypothetical protein